MANTSALDPMLTSDSEYTIAAVPLLKPHLVASFANIALEATQLKAM